MVAIHDDEGPVRLIGCAPLYKVPQTKWTPRLTVQLTVYVLFIGMSMAAGGLMPWLLEVFHGWKIGENNSLSKMFSQDPGYDYTNNNTYAFCPKNARVFSYDPLPRGYPAPPLAPTGGRLIDAWFHRPVTLKGVSWFGFNNAQGGPDGLWAGGSKAATDFAAIVYELQLLGFNTIRLPFTFETLQGFGASMVQKCNDTTTRDFAQHTTDPQAIRQPDYSLVPDPPIYLKVETYHAGLCNTYMPTEKEHVIQRFLWTIQYLIGNGFYVVLDYHPTANDTLAYSARDFARAWMYTWATIACLPNFASDIRGRLILDLVNEPDKLGLTWAGQGDLPGLDELYLTTMDSIENITRSDALYMLQGSALSSPAAGQGGSAVRNGYGLSPGDGFVTDASLIQEHQLSDPNPFFHELLRRSYRGRVLLGPHLYGPENSGVGPAAPAEVISCLNSSWGKLALEGYCDGTQCIRFPVVAGEMGSRLSTDDELSYYGAVGEYAGMGPNAASQASPLVGWIWWAYNANSEGTGGLVTDDWQSFEWRKLRYLINNYGLTPWYLNTTAFLESVSAQQTDALAARQAADAAAAAQAAEAAAAAAANPALNLTTVTNAVALVKAQEHTTAAATAEEASAGDTTAAAGTKAVQASSGAETVAASSADAEPRGTAGSSTETGGAAAAAASAANADARFTTFDTQLPPVIIHRPAAATPAAAVPAPAPVQEQDLIAASRTADPLSGQATGTAGTDLPPVDTHANLPTGGLDAGLQLEVPATVEEVLSQAGQEDPAARPAVAKAPSLDLPAAVDGLPASAGRP